MIEKRGIINDFLLNSKGEWNGTRIPRLRLQSIEEGKESEEARTEKEEIRMFQKSRLKLRRDWKPTDPRKKKYNR